MAKKSDLKQFIKSKEKSFFKYLKDAFEGEIFNFIKEISAKTEVYVFSGIIRNYFLHNYLIRDIDLVIESEEALQSSLSGISYKTNSFGGYKITIDTKTIDIWSIEKSWAFKHEPILNYQLERILPLTAFFNFSAIMYSFNRKEFICSEPFISFLSKKEIDYVYEPNANYSLCIVNTFYYADKYNLKISSRLLNFLQSKFLINADYQEIQMKHFGKVLYSEKEISKRLSEQL